MTHARARKMKLAARSLLVGAGACCLALVPSRPAWTVPLTIGGVMLPALGAAIGIGEMNRGGDAP